MEGLTQLTASEQLHHRDRFHVSAPPPGLILTSELQQEPEILLLLFSFLSLVPAWEAHIPAAPV